MMPTFIGGHLLSMKDVKRYDEPTEIECRILSTQGQHVGAIYVMAQWVGQAAAKELIHEETEELMAEASRVTAAVSSLASAEPVSLRGRREGTSGESLIPKSPSTLAGKRERNLPGLGNGGGRKEEGEANSCEVFLNVYNLLPFKSGIFHSGVQIKNQEFNYGFLDEPMTGVYRTRPKEAPFHYRETIHLGTAPFPFDLCKAKLMGMRSTWWGIDYDLLNNNCNDFSNAAAKELLGFGIPSWINAPARTLGKTEEARRVSKMPCQDPEQHYTKGCPWLKSPQKTGHLAKQGKGGSMHSENWKKRWMVLKGNFLWYFEEEFSREVLGCIPLLGCTLKHSSEGTDSFEISHPVTRNFFLSAYSPDDRAEWVAALYECTDKMEPVSSCEANREAMHYLVETRPDQVVNHWEYGIPEISNPTLKGTLTKQGSGFPWPWQERFFVLKGSGLWYFKEGKHEPAGVVDMEACDLVEQEGPEAPFKLIRPDKTEMAVRAGSDAIRQKWVAAMRNASERHKSGQDFDVVLADWLPRF